MRFTQLFLLAAPALLAAAQDSTTSDEDSSSTSVQSSNTNGGSSSQTSSARSSSSSSSDSESSSSSASASQSSGSDDDSDSNVVTRTWNGGRATFILSGGEVVGTVFNANQLASTLNENDNLETRVSNLPPTVYTTTGVPETSATTTDPLVKTKTVGGGPVTLILSDDQVVGTVYNVNELAETLEGNDNLKTRVSSVPLTTFTTSESIGGETQGSGNAAPVATGAPMLAGGLLGAGMVVVGLL